MKSRSSKSDVQGEFAFRSHGGPRKNAGRKRAGPRALVSHRTREVIGGKEPLHVTVRLMEGLPSLRRKPVPLCQGSCRLGSSGSGIRGEPC